MLSTFSTGIGFSDYPMADGFIIQHSTEIRIVNGCDSKAPSSEVLEVIRRQRCGGQGSGRFSGWMHKKYTVG